MHRTSPVDRSREAEALQKACQREGCPVCTVVLEHIDMVMNTWSYEGFTDVEHRQKVAQARGFCPLHTWQLAQRNTAFPLAVIYKNVLAAMEEELQQKQASLPHAPSNGGWFAQLKHVLQSHTPPLAESAHLYGQCFFCQARAKVEQRLIERLVGLLRTDAMVSLLRQSTGLCRVHFAGAVHFAEEHAPAQCAALIECQHTCVQRVLGEIHALIQKHDYRFSKDAHGDEMTSWRRASLLCVGNDGVR